MKESGIALIAGLGNPGDQYTATRHNVGFWFIEQLQREFQINFSLEKKFKAEIGHFIHNGNTIRVIAPNTFMNLSGESIAPMASFYRIEPANILVVHDELDLSPGSLRLKVGGGHGGHNGLRDIVSKLGTPDFLRLRIGIGHPGPNRDVSGYVLKRPLVSEQNTIESAIQRAINNLPDILSGDYQKAMNQLHTESEESDLDNNSTIESDHRGD